MAENLQPESMSTWMKGVERRLAALERPKASGSAALQIPMIDDPFNIKTISSSSFATAWQITIPVPVGDAISVQFDCNVLGTTPAAAVKLVTFNDETDELALNSGPQTVQFDWSPPDLEDYLQVGGDSPFYVYVTAKYTAGGSGVQVIRPARVIHGSSVDFDAAADGNGRII